MAAPGIKRGVTEGEIDEEHTSGAKARVDFMLFMPGLKPRPTARTSFSAACKAHFDIAVLLYGLKPCPSS